MLQDMKSMFQDMKPFTFRGPKWVWNSILALLIISAVVIIEIDRLSKMTAKDSAIEQSIQSEVAFKKLEKAAKEFSIVLLSGDEEKFVKMKKRFSDDQTGPALKDAFKKALSNNVSILLSNKFSIRNRIVFIDVNASAEDIIKFLVGE